jgi:hypothetical protein
MNKYNLKLIHLLYIHILLLFLQLPIRQLIIDTTFLRDVVIIFLFIYLLVTIKKVSGYSKFHVLISILLIFGIISSIYQLFIGFNVIDSIISYRNYFFPLILFFVSNKIFFLENNIKSFINFLYYIFLFLLVDIWIEYLLFEFNLPNTTLPWYSYQFQNSYRFTSSSNSNIESIDPSQTPVLGILGWPHATSATFLSLFLFFIPFIFDFKKINYLKLNFLKKALILILSTGAIIILGVKMQILIFLCILPIIVLLDRKVYLSMFIKYIPITLIVLFISMPFWYDPIVNRYNIAFSGDNARDSTLSLIFDLDIILGVLQAFFSNNPLNFFFGGYNLTEFWFFSLLEIRIINYTFEFGFIWLFLFMFILFYSILYSYRNYKEKINFFEKYIFFGFILFTISFVFDSLHYFRLMNWPNIDLFAILLGIINKKNKF